MAYFWEAQVRFTAEGGAPERFVTLAAQAGIPLWNTSRRGAFLYASCHARRYAALRPLARRSGMRLRVRRRRGLPFLLRSLRKGLVVGGVLAALLLFFLSRGIWVITVQGNRTVPTEEILGVLEPLGVRVGGNFAAVDIPALQLTALQKFPQLGWLTVNQNGCVLTVQVAEKEPTAPLPDTTPANLVAACDGVVVSVSVTGGQAAVKVGDAVTKGSLLISGITDSPVGPLLRRASGSVIARVTVTLTAEVPLKEFRTVPTPVLRQPSLYLLGVTVPLYTDGGEKETYTPVYEERLLTVEGNALPLGWRITTYTAPETVLVTHTPEEAAALAAQSLAVQEEQALIDATVESRIVKEQRLPDRVIVTGTYVCLREITVAEKIL